MPRDIRYQGAIVRDHQVLLIRHQDHDTGRTYWLLPGGGREDPETEEACVAREMSEETGLAVTVVGLVLDEPDGRGVYQRRRTYLCTADTGEAQPGYEPELEASEIYGIVEVRWFDLRDADTWDPLLRADAITFPQLQRLQAALGYTDAAAGE
jgi:8-oxo-dGTP pyrophosphatase MutT (NUDIX family)